LEFETVTVAGQTNILGQPILIPALDTESSRIVGGDQDVTIKMTGVAGLELTVFANSVTCPPGTPDRSQDGTQCRVTISQVHLDKVPMPPPGGIIFMPPAWTIQPAGVKFDPPAPITIPNNGLPPGRVIDIFQFDHTLNQFINVGKGTVSEDGSVITSDPGFGITAAGWGGGGPPPPPTTMASGPECSFGPDDFQPPLDGERELCPEPDIPAGDNHGDGKYSLEGLFRENPDGTDRPHPAVDIQAEAGEDVFAPADGIVDTAKGDFPDAGNQIVIVHEDGTFTRYFHLQDMQVGKNDEVTKGQKIGTVGTTGNAEGTTCVHLHFEIRDENFEPVDPTGCLF
jgi:hypothetical protein